MYSRVSGMYLTCILALVGVRPEYIQDTRDTLTLLWYSCIPRPFGRPSYDTYRYTPDTHPIHIHTTVPRPGHRYIHDTTAYSGAHVCGEAAPAGPGHSRCVARGRLRQVQPETVSEKENKFDLSYSFSGRSMTML